MTPRPELMDAAGWHPACRAAGNGPASRTAPLFCTAAAEALKDRGLQGVEVLARNDERLARAGHVTLGFTLADTVVGGRHLIAISALLYRSDRNSGALYPPAAAVLDGNASRADLAHAAATLLRDLGI